MEKALHANIKGFQQPNIVLLRGKVKKGLPLEKVLRLIAIKTPQLGLHQEPDEPWAFEAREFLRTAFLGLPVDFYIEHKRFGKEYGRIIVEGKDIALSLLEEGLARVEAAEDFPEASN